MPLKSFALIAVLLSTALLGGCQATLIGQSIPDPKLSAPDPDPERGQPGVSLLPVREPVEPGPDVVDPGLEPSPA